MSRRRLSTLLLLAFVAGLLGGCAKRQAAAPVPQADPLSAAPANLTLMSPDQKSGRIAHTFPFQVPVPVGQVQRGEAQGNTAWDYEIDVSGGKDAVMRWYYDAYSNAEWQLVGRTPSELTLRKNAAESRLDFTPLTTTPPTTRVTAIVGVGTHVLGTE
jgi:hypothetical protein